MFDRSFIFDSYSSRARKGTHAAVNRLESFFRKASRNFRSPAWAFKCDIRKFFDSVDHVVLLNLIRKKLRDQNTLWLIEKIIKGFESEHGKGLPLGNVTSQLFANVYLNEFDQFVKRTLRVHHYIRYSDDFVFVREENDFDEVFASIKFFLQHTLLLELHPRKIIIRKYQSGVDFLGYVLRPYHRTLRTKTKHRLLNRIREQNLHSYLGVLDHCNGYKIKRMVEKRLTDSHNQS